MRQAGQPAGHRFALRRRQWHRHRIPDGRGPPARPARMAFGPANAPDRIRSACAGRCSWLGSWIACGAWLAASPAPRPAENRPGALGSLAVPGGVDALAAAAGLPVPAPRATVALELIRRLHGASAGDPAAAARRQAVVAALAQPAAGAAAAAGATIPLPFDEDLWTRMIFRRDGDVRRPRRGDPDQAAGRVVLLRRRRARRRDPRLVPRPPASPAPHRRPGRRLRRLRPEPARARRARWRRRADRPPIRCGRRWSAPRRPTPTRSSTSCSAPAPAGSPGSTTPSAGSMPGCSGTCWTATAPSIACVASPTSSPASTRNGGSRIGRCGGRWSIPRRCCWSSRPGRTAR